MGQIRLGNKGFALVDDEDVARVSTITWHIQENNRFGRSFKYATRRSPNYVAMHRFILNAPKNLIVDHINGDGLDNRKENLRLCTYNENARNRRPNLHHKTIKTMSKYKGVVWIGCKDGLVWLARIYDNKLKKDIRISRHKNDEEAALAYNAVAIKLYGKFAYLNRIGG